MDRAHPDRASGLLNGLVVVDRVEEVLERCTFPPPGSPLTCAVSGGPDSLALLVLAVAAGCRATAMHVDHGLRPGSERDVEAVAAAAERLGAAFQYASVDVGPGPNLEERARRARWSVLPADAATGHTADDQAETLLLNLLRGAGLAGTAAMRPGLRHPLLALRRAETEAVCRSAGLEPLRDPSNDDPTHRRNRVRHEILPLLAEVAGRDVVPLLVRHAEQSRAAVDHLDVVAAETLPDPADVAALRAAPGVVVVTALRGWLRACSPDGHPPDAASIDRVLAVLRHEVRATEIAGGWRVERRSGRLVLVPPSDESQRFQER